MNYLFISDCLWYLGHVTTGISILYIQNNNNNYLAISTVLFSQFCIIISRPIGRIKNTKKYRTISNMVEEKTEIFEPVVLV